MKFKINRNHFSAGLQRVLNIVGGNLSMPILNNALVEAKDKGVFLTTTNLDQGIRCYVQAEVTEPGILALPVRKLATIVKELPSLDVEIELASENQIKLKSGTSRFKISGMKPDEFPPLPDFDNEHHFETQQEDLLRRLKSVSYAKSDDQSRYILNGVLFQFDAQDVTLVATDGRRLALMGKPIAKDENDGGHIVLPGKTVEELQRLLPQGEKVKIAFNDRQVAFNIEVADADTGLAQGIYLVSKVLEGDYPDYKPTIMMNDLQLKIDRDLLLDSIRRAALVTSDQSSSVVLSIKENQLEVSSQSNEYGESQETLAVQYQGEEVSIAFNPDYLLDPLRSLTRDEIIFEFKDEFSPGMLRTLDEFMCVIMPLRLN